MWKEMLPQLVQILIVLMLGIQARLEVNDSCTTQSMPGLCKAWSDCPIIQVLIVKGLFTKKSVGHCGFNINEELICCPMSLAQMHPEENKEESREPPPPPPKPKPIPSKKRIPLPNEPRRAVKACQKYERGLIPSLTHHILGGELAELGEYPHMAAINYSSGFEENRSPYQVRCGGSLISERFVVTAGHCVNSRDLRPRNVLLGIVNLTDPQEIRTAVNVGIKEIHNFIDYRISETYNDIALLELQHEVQLSQNVYPICLHTDDTDPSQSEKINVIGWGVTNITTRSTSKILLQAPLEVVSITNCNESYKKKGSVRRLEKGIINTQLCAKGHSNNVDACSGDSGGPLNLIVDKVNRRYRLLGIVSAGSSCGTDTPGLYTRVSSFLDFIESTVWPNGVI